jgi:transcriptional regulator with XRE-family HTH domain
MVPPLTAVIGGNIRYARAKRGITQKQLAASMGIATGTVSQIERGARVVTVNELLPICEALDVDLRFLVDGLGAEDVRRLGL